MRRLTLAVGCVLSGLAAAARADDVTVAAGASVQAAIDAAAAGATVRLPAGTVHERLTITRPVTLAGAGWDRTTIEADPTFKGHTDAEKLALGTQLDGAADEAAQEAVIREYTSRRVGPTVTVRAAHVTLRGIGVRGVAASGGPGVECLVRFDGATDARLVECGLVGPAGDGIDVVNASDVDVRHCLVAAVWGTGVAVGGQAGGRVHLADSDVRNCYYAGVTLGDSSDSVVDRCRISGAAWHGVRYDGGSPTLTGNLIFGNARCGVYASGATHAAVRGNVFWRNEMDAVSCWFANADTIERNTIVGNEREGVMVCGDARPTLTANVIAGSPVGVACSGVNGQGGDPRPTLAANLFWQDKDDYQRMGHADPLPAGNDRGDPHFAPVDKPDFALPVGASVGAADVLAVDGPWPVQPAERAMVPDGDTRDFSQWKKPDGVR